MVIFESAETRADLDLQINIAQGVFCDEFGIDRILVKAIRKRESNGDTFAKRLEPQLLKRKWAQDCIMRYNIATNQPLLAYSLGEMQVLFLNSVDNGYMGSPIGLLVPETNMRYGIKYLARLFQRFAGQTFIYDRVVAAYNAGGCNYYDLDGDKKFEPDDGEKFYNQDYVDFVKNHYKLLGGVNWPAK